MMRILGILALVGFSAPLHAQLFVGTGSFGGTSLNDAAIIDVDTNTASSVFSGVAVWGAAYDFPNDRVLITVSGGTTDGADIFAWPVGGGTPTQIGTIQASGADLRIDGLAMLNGTLYGVHQFDDAAGAAGIYQIDLGTFAATFVLSLGSGDVSGIDGDDSSGLIYGANDTTGNIVAIDVANNTVSNVAIYPAAKDDIDGVAVGRGKIFLIPDDDTPGEIFVYDIAGGTYDPSLTAPWGATAKIFSGGAFTESNFVVPTLQTWALVLFLITLATAGVMVMRRRRLQQAN